MKCPFVPGKIRLCPMDIRLRLFILSLTRQGSAEGLTRGWDRLPADLRDAGTDGPPPGSCRFAGDLRVASCVRWDAGQCRCADLDGSGARIRSAPRVAHGECLLPGHQTSAARGTQDQLTRMNLPLPPAVVGGRRAITGLGTPGNHGSSVTI